MIDPCGTSDIKINMGLTVALYRLRAQRAQLLAVLKTIAYEPIGRSDASNRDVLDAITEMARAAIAKIKVASD